MELTVKLQVFEGPLDLLLHLLDKNKVNIYDIPIVEITNQYMEYIREMKRRASRETSLERLPMSDMDKLCSADDYPSDSYVFSYCGYDLPISSEQVADAFASLPEQEQSILILRLVLDLTDSEIGDALGLSRSAVQRRRTKSLKALRTKLTVRKGG